MADTDTAHIEASTRVVRRCNLFTKNNIVTTKKAPGTPQLQTPSRSPDCAKPKAADRGARSSVREGAHAARTSPSDLRTRLLRRPAHYPKNRHTQPPHLPRRDNTLTHTHPPHTDLGSSAPICHKGAIHSHMHTRRQVHEHMQAPALGMTAVWKNRQTPQG